MKSTIKLLTIKDLPLPRTTIWRLRRNGHLKSLTIGRRVYFRLESVREFLQNSEQRETE